jgi:hypothetical protein
VSPAEGVTGNLIRFVGSATTHFTFTGLTNGTGYTFKIAAINISGTGANSSVSGEVTPSIVPGAPTSVGGTSNENTQITVTWTAPASNGGSAITDYEVTVYNSTGGDPVEVKGDWTRSVGSSGTTFVFTGLANGTSYTFKVRAINASGEGSYSTASEADTPSSVASAPTSVAGTSNENGQSTVTWTAPFSNGGSAITDYEVTVYNSVGGDPVGVTGDWTRSVGSSGTTFIFTGLTNGNSYTFKVRAINGSGTGSYSTASTADTPSTVPDAPTVISVTAGNGQATIYFTPPTNDGGFPITSYTVTASSGGHFTTGASSPLVVTGLTNGVAYYFVIKANNDIGVIIFFIHINSFFVYRFHIKVYDIIIIVNWYNIRIIFCRIY